MSMYESSARKKSVAGLFVAILIASTLVITSGNASGATTTSEENWQGYLPAPSLAVSPITIDQVLTNCERDVSQYSGVEDNQIALGVSLSEISKPHEDYYEVSIGVAALASRDRSYDTFASFMFETDLLRPANPLVIYMTDNQGKWIDINSPSYCSYYGAFYSSVFIATNGYVSFDKASYPYPGTYSNVPALVPGSTGSDGVNAVAAPLSKDFSAGATVSHGVVALDGSSLWYAIIWESFDSSISGETFGVYFPLNDRNDNVFFMYDNCQSISGALIGHEDQTARKSWWTNVIPDYGSYVDAWVLSPEQIWGNFRMTISALKGVSTVSQNDVHADVELQGQSFVSGMYYAAGTNVGYWSGESMYTSSMPIERALGPAIEKANANAFHDALSIDGQVATVDRVMDDMAPAYPAKDWGNELIEPGAYRGGGQEAYIRVDTHESLANPILAFDSILVTELVWRLYDDVVNVEDVDHTLQILGKLTYAENGAVTESYETSVTLKLAAMPTADDGVSWFARTIPDAHDYSFAPITTAYGTGYHIDSAGSSDSGYDMMGWNIAQTYTVSSYGQIKVTGYFRQAGYTTGCYLKAYVLDANDLSVVLASSQLLTSADGSSWVYKEVVFHGLTPGKSVRVGIGRPDTLVTDYSLAAEWAGVTISTSGYWPPSITVTSPNGGENWQIGTGHTITWTYANNPGSYVKIELYRVSTLTRTITSSTACDGSYSWTIPTDLTTASDYRIKITSTSMTSVYDYSNAYFSITAPTITVTSPNGGEVWGTGSDYTIYWTSENNPGSYVKIELYKGASLSSTLSSSTLNDGYFGWTIPVGQTVGTDYRVKISSTTTSAYDYSDGYFSIVQSWIAVTSPNGGEAWQPGTSHYITWDYGGISDGFYVYLYRGATYQYTICPRTLDSSYLWTIPADQAIGSDYRVMVGDHDMVASDYSDNYFTIGSAPEPSITVTSPNGGESWQMGTSHAVTWTYANNPGSYVKIELYRSSTLVLTITSSTACDGYYTWTISTGLTAASDYRIKISSTTTAASDYSNAYFTITKQQFALTVTCSEGTYWTMPDVGVHYYDVGTSVYCAAVADTGYKFKYWLVDGTTKIKEQSFYITMDTSHTVYAYCTAGGGGGGGGPPSGPKSEVLGLLDAPSVSALPMEHVLQTLVYEPLQSLPQVVAYQIEPCWVMARPG